MKTEKPAIISSAASMKNLPILPVSASDRSSEAFKAEG
jgi:hypothetical protein